MDEVPKSMVLRRTKMEKEGKFLEAEVRELLYPFTSMHLKESVKLKLKDILEASKNFGVKNIVFLTSKNENLYLKFLVTPHGPTLTFKVNTYVLSGDLQKLLPKNKSINPTSLGVPMVICKGFDEQANEVSLMHSLFKNLFPGVLHHKNLTANSFKRCVFVLYNKAKGVVEIRNYYLKKAFSEINKSIKKMLNSNALLDFGKFDDVGDLLVGNDHQLSDSDVDFLPNAKVQLEDNVLGKRKKHQMSVRLYVRSLGDRTEVDAEADEDRGGTGGRGDDLPRAEVEDGGGKRGAAKAVHRPGGDEEKEPGGSGCQREAQGGREAGEAVGQASQVPGRRGEG